MQKLEKILEEINAEFDRRIRTQLKIMAGTNDDVYRYGYGKSLEAYQQGKLFVEDIIRKHMNDGWIPVEERLPEVDEDIEETTEDDDCPEYNVTIRGASESTTLKYSPDGTWFDKNGYVYDVIAWRPMPEVYRPADKTERSEQKCFCGCVL